MVVGAFPLSKLGALLMRQVSKPIAELVKNRAKRNPVFRKYICIPPAHFYNWCEIKAKMWIMGLGKPTVVPSLNENLAIELGANLLGEGVVFAIAAVIVSLEYVRQSNKESAKEMSRQKEISALGYVIRELNVHTEKQDSQIRELLQTVSNLHERMQLIKKALVMEEEEEENENDIDPASLMGIILKTAEILTAN